ncbi:Hypothetical protein PHPALM_6359 [Phytophthora palmivora]|uniref:Uncharacterized protein n=1 Tax=Phytophthora palmivora TaxID=4796 RepID=A0A2P4YEZ9_9STRA|nr:Hypothetical protein PHPALM_6359 [Phytophthora palmivora]
MNRTHDKTKTRGKLRRDYELDKTRKEHNRYYRSRRDIMAGSAADWRGIVQEEEQMLQIKAQTPGERQSAAGSMNVR